MNEINEDRAALKLIRRAYRAGSAGMLELSTRYSHQAADKAVSANVKAAAAMALAVAETAIAHERDLAILDAMLAELEVTP